MASATSTNPTDRRVAAPRREALPERTRIVASRLAGSPFGGALLLGNTLALILLVFAGLGVVAYRDGMIAEREAAVTGRAATVRVALGEPAVAGCRPSACIDSAPKVAALLRAAGTGFGGSLALYGTREGLPVLVAEADPGPEEGTEVVPVPKTLPRTALPTRIESSMVKGLEALIRAVSLRGRLGTGSVEEQLARAGEGTAETVLYPGRDGTLFLASALPLTENGRVVGVVLAKSEGFAILGPAVRNTLLPVTLITFAAASLSALLLTAAVTQPLRQLSAAAERVRRSVGRASKIRLPDLDSRRDDVGRLSRSFRAMTEALVERIETIDSFAADVSHELKNPLTSIRSAVETLPKCKTEQQRERLLGVITNDVDRMDRLISDISSASRLDAQLATESRHPLSAAKLVRDIAASYKSVTEQGGPPVSFRDETEGGGIEPCVFGSPGALGRVIRNLVDNAVSFSPEGGAVTVAVEKSPKARQLVLITVADEGPGVPKENLESIFDRFYTSRPQGATFGSNSGLGLAIARQIVESHGGRVWAENVKSKDLWRTGARFCVELPLHRGGFG